MTIADSRLYENGLNPKNPIAFAHHRHIVVVFKDKGYGNHYLIQFPDPNCGTKFSEPLASQGEPVSQAVAWINECREGLIAELLTA